MLDIEFSVGCMKRFLSYKHLARYWDGLCMICYVQIVCFLSLVLPLHCGRVHYFVTEMDTKLGGEGTVQMNYNLQQFFL